MSNKSDEIIRCKDCYYYKVYTFKDGTTKSDCDYISIPWHPYEVEENDYCSRAIRKEENK